VVKLNKIYTRTGDDGTTGLADGSRLPKSAARVAAAGTVEEANAIIGLALIEIEDAGWRAMLGRIQNELFDLGADFATPADDFTDTTGALRMVPRQVERLEQEIDAMNADLSPLRSFILPGGARAAALVHVARTVVRRAERLAVEAAAAAPINPVAIAYVNRLSDHLFVLGRVINAAAGGDPLWQPGATRGD
jgi:cob(I)alamin adenosyltransferase